MSRKRDRAADRRLCLTDAGRLLAVVTAAALVLLGAGVTLAASQNGIVRPTYEPPKATVKLGEELFSANCASCHGIGGEGIVKPRPGAGDLTGMGPSLRGVGAMAADFYLRTGFMPLANIHDQPSQQRVLFTSKEITAITAFVAALGKGPGVPHPQPARADLAQGFELFTEDCAGCHQSLARGGFVTGARVPPLQKVSATEIAEAVRIGPYVMPRFGPRRLSDRQLDSIVLYVRSTNAPDNRGGFSIGNLGPIPEGLVAWLAALILAVLCLTVGRRLKA
ncbi:MAG TPA: c-type cytochrome [Solirubrobacteraceae bacterium]|jgi:ubiquinol-cytochrome c reductase cytochrome c subunit